MTDATAGPAGRRGATRVLALERVCLTAASGDPGDDLAADLEIAAGQVVMVHVTRPRQGSLLADVCAGVVGPGEGRVLFMDRDWQDLGTEDTNALRSLLGRVFYEGHWLGHLDMTDNILLAHLHHTRRERADLLSEAAQLSRHFGLPGLPSGRHWQLDRAQSQRAACVRAFLGAPRLIVLEHPTGGAFSQLLAPLVNAVRAACDRGAAVLWLTPSQRVWRDRSIPVTRRLRIARTSLVAGDARL